MRFHALHLKADVRFEIIERMEMRRLTRDNSHLLREFCPQFVLLHFQQAAVGVVDDDELLRVEQMMRNDQRAQGIFGGDASGITDHVRVSGMQAQAVLEQDAGIHAGENRDVAAGADREISQGEVAGESFVGL